MYPQTFEQFLMALLGNSSGLINLVYPRRAPAPQMPSLSNISRLGFAPLPEFRGGGKVGGTPAPMPRQVGGATPIPWFRNRQPTSPIPQRPPRMYDSRDSTPSPTDGYSDDQLSALMEAERRQMELNRQPGDQRFSNQR